jgi:hypothetical protein
VARIPKDLGKKMLYGYGHREISRAKTIEELWQLADAKGNQFFDQYEQHKQFDRRLVGESKSKDKQQEKKNLYLIRHHKTSLMLQQTRLHLEVTTEDR